VNFPPDPPPPDDTPADPAPAAADVPAVSSELADWKAALRHDFETWLASIDELPAADAAGGVDPADAPDLYSFHAQLTAASAESRKANRRTAEAMSQWGETLARFESGLQPLRDAAAQLAAAQPKAGQMSRAHCLMLAELLDRMHRLAAAFARPPGARRSWWTSAAGDEAWRKAWAAQHDALGILVGHLEGLLQKEGVTRLATLGQVFDPAVMMAVAAEADATRPPQTVLEETAAGYLRHGELLRAAQVKVSRQP
jgi:hypothetical protein